MERAGTRAPALLRRRKKTLRRWKRMRLQRTGFAELELLLDELDEELELELDDELDSRCRSRSSGAAGFPKLHAWPSAPRPARAAPPESTRRNSRRSSRRASSGRGRCLNMGNPPARLRARDVPRVSGRAYNGWSAPPS